MDKRCTNSVKVSSVLTYWRPLPEVSPDEDFRHEVETSMTKYVILVVYKVINIDAQSYKKIRSGRNFTHGWQMIIQANFGDDRSQGGAWGWWNFAIFHWFCRRSFNTYNFIVNKKYVLWNVYLPNAVHLPYHMPTAPYFFRRLSA